MEFFNSKTFIFLIVLMLFVGGLTGCAKKHIEMDHPRQPTTLETIGKLEAIGTVLGCMFDPAPCQKKKELQDKEDIKFEVQE